VYFTIQNPSDQADILIDAESEIAEFVELHMTSMDANGNMQMQHQESVPVGCRQQCRICTRWFACDVDPTA
jgi:copper(I)-binding protein